MPVLMHRTNHYWLMSRFMFPFIIIALFFATCSLFLGLVAICTRIGSYMSSLLTWLAWVFQAITASLMTYSLSLHIYKSIKLTIVLTAEIEPASSKAATTSIRSASAQAWVANRLGSCGLPWLV